jgi:hypothetical protein
VALRATLGVRRLGVDHFSVRDAPFGTRCFEVIDAHTFAAGYATCILPDIQIGLVVETRVVGTRSIIFVV